MRLQLIVVALVAACGSEQPTVPGVDAAPDVDPCAAAGEACTCVSGAGLLRGTRRCAGAELVCDCPLPDVAPGMDVSADAPDDAPAELVDAPDAEAGLDAPAPDAQVADADAACETTCDGACVDAAFDPFNCGACGVRCVAAPPHTRAQCFGGRCETPCQDAYRDCNGTLADGCETFVLGTDRANCGSCRSRCSVKETCVMGVCRHF